MNSRSRKALNDALTEYRRANYNAALLILAETDIHENDFMDMAYITGLCHTRLENWDEALLYLEQIVTGDSPEARVDQCRLILAYIYSVTGRTRLAEYELEKLMEDGRESSQLYSSMAHIVWSQGRLEDGLAWYLKALALDPENSSALNGYGYLLACAGRDLPRALTACRKAYNSKPDNPAYMDSLGWAYLKLGMLPEAEKFLKQAEERLSGNSEMIMHIKALEEALRI